MNITGKIFQTVLAGIGGTIFMDLWGLLMKSFGIKGLDMAHLGRWVLTWPQGKWFHSGIAQSPEMPGELIAGWLVHYMIGISLVFLLVSVYGFDWLERPNLRAAVTIGLVTVLAPLMILQPALGLGYFASKAANPALSILRSVGSHLIYGIGLYATALLLRLIPQ